MVIKVTRTTVLSEKETRFDFRMWEHRRGTGVNISSENGQYLYNFSFEAPCLP